MAALQRRGERPRESSTVMPATVLTTGDSSYSQPFDVAIDEALIVAEEKLLPRGLYSVVRLALQQFNRRRFGLRLVAETTKRSCQRRKGPVRDIGLPGRPAGKLDGNVILAKGEMRPGANEVKAPQMAVSRTEHGRPIKQRFRFDLPPVPQQIESLRKISLREARIEFQRQVDDSQRFVILT